MLTPIELHSLRTLLETMDVPNMRRGLDKPANVRWLLRNVAVRNFNNAGLTEVMGLLRALSKAQQDDMLRAIEKIAKKVK